MFRNYLATALRNLVRNKLYAAINVVGLAVGLSTALLMVLFLRDEFSYDKWIPGYERTFMVTETLWNSGRTPTESHKVPVELAAPLKLDFPQIKSMARMVGAGASVRHGESEGNETIYWADPEIFDVLPLAAVAGDLKTALNSPDGLVLTRRVAEKYFGKTDPIGATLEIDRQHPMRVAAVIEDLPPNTHLGAEVFGSGLASFSFLSRRQANPLPPGAWNSAGYTYLRLARGAAGDELERAMPDFLERRMKASVAGFEQVSLWITPLASVHMRPENNTTAMKPTSDPKTSYAFGVIGFLVLLVAGINFVNLMTARATRRAMEVGVRKVTGASRPNLIVQFLGESLLYAVIGSAIALVIIDFLLPTFNAFLDRRIAFNYVRDYALGGGIACIVLILGTLAGAYPAFVLSGFRPASALKIKQKHANAGRLRRALVILQFAILVGLVVGVGVVYRQSSFALNEGLRLDKEQVVLVATRCQTSFAERVRALPGVRAAACSQRNGLSFASGNGPFRREGREPITVSEHSIDFGYLELYGMRPLAGRFFSRDYAGDSTPFDLKSAVGPNVVINETAARRFEFTSPEAAIGQTVTPAIPGEVVATKFEIVGVVPDFSFDSVHSLIPPSLYLVNAPSFQWLSIKLSGSDLPETLRAIDTLWKEVGDPRPMTRLFLDQEMERVYLDIKRQSQLLAAFSTVAIFISALGLFGLAAFTAEQRTKEIGVRKAMGARTYDVLRLLLWQFVKPVLWANAIAWPVCYFVMKRWLEGFAYRIDLSPWIFLGASALALVIAILTVAGHALLVARAQPVTALRYE